VTMTNELDYLNRVYEIFYVFLKVTTEKREKISENN
jgi:hypothetical protein